MLLALMLCAIVKGKTRPSQGSRRFLLRAGGRGGGCSCAASRSAAASWPAASQQASEPVGQPTSQIASQQSCYECSFELVSNLVRIAHNLAGSSTPTTTTMPDGSPSAWWQQAAAAADGSGSGDNSSLACMMMMLALTLMKPAIVKVGRLPQAMRRAGARFGLAAVVLVALVVVAWASLCALEGHTKGELVVGVGGCRQQQVVKWRLASAEFNRWS